VGESGEGEPPRREKIMFSSLYKKKKTGDAKRKGVVVGGEIEGEKSVNAEVKEKA